MHLATRAAASSPSQTFKIATSKTTTFHSLATYVVSAAGITALHIISTYANEPPNPRGDHHLAVFVRSRFVNFPVLRIPRSEIVEQKASILSQRSLFVPPVLTTYIGDCLLRSKYHA